MRRDVLIGEDVGVSRHYRAVPGGEVPIWIWNASKLEWMLVGAIGGTTRRYNPARHVSEERRRQLFTQAGHRCQWPSGCKWSDLPLSIDHIVPLSQGGSNRDENLQVLCIRHNGDKAREDQKKAGLQ